MIQRLTGSSRLGRGDARARPDPVHLQEPRRVPQLGREIPIPLDPLLIQFDVAALALHRRHGEAHRVGAVAVDQAQGIDRIVLRLGHFLAVRVADQAVEVERPPRRLLGELQPRHRHPRIPEEQDVEARDQHVVGVVALQLLGRLRPAQRRERPQRRRKPGVEHILVLAQRRGRRPLAALPPRSRRRRCFRHRQTTPECGGPTTIGATRTRDGCSPAS